MRTIGGVALAASLALVACNKTETRTPAIAPITPVVTSISVPATATASAEPGPSAAADSCANSGSVIANSSLRLPGSISGDVDGDGSSDHVGIALDRTAPEGCQAFLVADTASGVVGGSIAEWSLTGGLPQPRLHSVAQIDGSGGDEVVVDVEAGASTEFVSVFSDVDSSFVALTLPKEAPGSPKDVFAYGGSVGHLDGVDCAPDGGIVVSFATPSGQSYRVVRHFYSVDKASLKPDDARDQTTTSTFAGLDRFPEFAAAPFGSCST